MLLNRIREIIQDAPPLPGSGQTTERHKRFMQVGREDLSLARLAEAHWDAVAILSEAKRAPVPGALYGVWASEIPGMAIGLERIKVGWQIDGSKMFCSGAGIVDHALMTVGSPLPQLLQIDLSKHRSSIAFDESSWKTSAFAETKTATAKFTALLIDESEFVGDPGWYLERAGFWHGACGPAACWAGGAAGLLDYALRQSRRDAHSMAHLGAMSADMWAMEACLEHAGRGIDADPMNVQTAHVRALTVRHLVEQACTDVLRRLTRAYGPHPLAMDEGVSRRYQELDLYVRQSHAERDLAELGIAVEKKM